MTHEEIVRDTNIDYRREMVLVAGLNEEGERKIIGMGTLAVNPDGESGEFAVVIGDPWQHLGLGKKLVDMIIGVADAKGLSSVQGMIRRDNEAMQHICREMGFTIKVEDMSTAIATLRLR